MQMVGDWPEPPELDQMTQAKVSGQTRWHSRSIHLAPEVGDNGVSSSMAKRF